ncbi:MAG: phosphate ABC transporter permease PstA, partial [Clostridiales bacterium]|nr:phosphate ABC transporter permease PstA [Clostridiales bacterium]
MYGIKGTDKGVLNAKSTETNAIDAKATEIRSENVKTAIKKIKSVKKSKHNSIRYAKNAFFHIVIAIITAGAVAVLFLLVADIVKKGLPWLSVKFLTSFPSRLPTKSGILPALAGSAWIIALTAAFSIPVGIGTAIYLEEYAGNSRLTKLIKINISNLSGTPSIVYGLLGLTVFVRALALGRGILSGALTLSLVVLPIIIVASQEAIKAVPQTMRHGSFAMGATRWQTVRKIVLPTAFPGILTGIILSISRGIGESAPLLMVGAF